MAALNPEVLGQILILSNLLHAAPNDRWLGEVVVNSLATAPGVDSVAVYFNDTFVVESTPTTPAPWPWPPVWREVVVLQSPERCGGLLPSIAIQTARQCYGQVVFKLANLTEITPYQSYLENAVNTMALIIETNRQQASLEVMAENLEKDVAAKVAKLVEAESKRREADLKYREAVKAANVGLWDWDLTTDKVRFSAEWKAQSGYQEDEIGDDIDEWRSRVHPDDLAEAVQQVQHAIDKKSKDFHAEFRFRHMDGTYRWILAQGSVISDANGHPQRMMGSHVDISERKLAEERIRESSDRLEQLAEHSRTFIWEVDADGLYTYVSPVCATVLGYRPEEIVGQLHFYDLHPEDGREEFRDNTLETMSRHEPFKTFVNLAQTRSGQAAWLSTNGMPILDADGNLRGYRGSSIDITAQKELEYQSMRAAQLAAIGELASGIAHEINNPINGIINYAQIMLDRSNIADKDRDILGRIIKEGGRVATIVRDLLFFSRDSGKQMSVIFAQKTIHDALALSGKQMEKEGVELIIELVDHPLLIKVNPQQIEQVWLNLISNARHALQEQKKEDQLSRIFKISMEQVSPHGRPCCRTTFLDNGPGIPEQVLRQVFRPFFTTKPAGVGTGLGLSISVEIVKSFGGGLTIDSKEGEYTRVTVELPLAEK